MHRSVRRREHIWTLNETEEETNAELVYVNVAPTVDYFPTKGAIGEGFALAHLDTPGAGKRTVTIKGKTYQDKKGLSLRDHAWEIRDWGNFGLSRRWVVGTCDPDISFVAVSWQNAQYKIANFG